ncbi:MAG TPA: Ig-like domain-containing protein, partial [Bacillota bacterium]|nr:Ig-like domain-containing protein [Bacillota bacterium]
ISTNGGTNWTELTHFTGGTQPWQWVKLDLSAYKTSNVKIRFFEVAWATTNDGWYIDDIRVGEPYPAVTEVTPGDSLTGVAVSSPIKVTFDKMMDASTINTSNFTVKDSLNNQISGTITNYDGYTFYFTPSQNLVYNTVYTATLTTGVKAEDGTALVNPYVWRFTTAGVDSIAPTGTLVIGNNIASRLSNVTIRATATDDNSGVAFVQLSNTTDFTEAVWSPFTPSAPWLNYVDLPWKMLTTDNVVHESGTKTVYARFKDSVGYVSEVVSATISYDSNTTYFVDDAEGAPQMSAVSPWGKVDFYSHSGTQSWADSPSGKYKFDSYTNWGYVQHNTTPNTNAFTTSSQVPIQVFSTPVLDLTQTTKPYLSFWQRYDFDNNGGWDQAYGVVQISVDGGSNWTELGHYTGTQPSWQAVNFNLSAYKSSTVKIRFFLATGYPSGKDGWYLDDIRVGEPNPSVTASGIADGAVGVPVNSVVYATFDSAVDLASINTSTFSLKDAGGNLVPGSFSVNGNTVTFKPTGNLAYNTTFTATITEYVMGVSGYPVDKVYKWSFTTKPLDNVAPTGSMTINDNSGITSSTYATLNLSVTDDNSGMSKMQFANTDGPWDTVPWVNYATSYTWRLTVGEGIKTVYGRFMDVQGNVYSVSASVYFDSFGINPINPWSLTKQVTISGTVEPGSTVNVTTDTFTLGGQATVTGSTWQYTIRELTAGDNNITVTATKSGVTRPAKTVKVSFLPYFFDYLEDPQKSLYYGNSGRTSVSANVYSGVYAWASSPTGNYLNYARNWLMVGPTHINIAVKPVLYYKYKTFLADTGDKLTLSQDLYSFNDFRQLSGADAQISTTRSQWTEGVVDLNTIIQRASNHWYRFRFDSNGSGTAAGAFVDNVVIAEANDTTAPDATNALKINNDAAATMSTSVTLTLSATDSTPAIANGFPTYMQFSDDGAYWSPWENYDTTKDWQLTATSGTKYVYARFMDNAGNISATISKTISLDVTPPVVGLNAVPASVNTNSYTISGTAND